jgi:Zn-dependent oligopeptidase
MDNPLLEMEGLPPFCAILPEMVGHAIDRLLAACRARIEELTSRADPPTWESFVEPLEEVDDRLKRVWSPINHLNAVMNGDDLRAAYNACLPKLSEYGTEVGQNRALFEGYLAVASQEHLDAPQRKLLENALRDFHLSGVDLPAEEKARFKEVNREITELVSSYEENLLDATNAWSKQVTDEDALAGLPESALALAKQTAEERGLEGWVLTLDLPSYLPAITYADDRELRYEVYKAYCTRASDQGPHAGKWDNTQIMDHILALRHELAMLLGFGNYAERSLAIKMARSTAEVMVFLNDLAERSLIQARREPIPEALYRRMRAARNFQSGRQMVRQLEFAIFDFRLHLEYDPRGSGRIYEILDEVRDQVAVMKPPAFNRFAHSFSHIFSGGYAAGYYSYKWAEVLSADAFSLFEERGVFDSDAGRAFRENILEQGGSADAMDLYVSFRGREPMIDALLRHSGIAS